MPLLLMYLLGILSAVGRQYKKHPEHNSKAADNPQGEIKNTRVIFLEENIREYRRNQEEQSTIQNSLRWATWLTFIAVFIYAAITLAILYETRNSVELMRKQVNSGQAAVLWITFDIHYEPGFPYGLNAFVLYQSGSATASNIHASFDVSFKSEPGLRDAGSPQHFDFIIPQFAVTKNGLVQTNKPIKVQGLTPDIWKQIHESSKDQTIKIEGTFGYSNGFERIPDQRFCYVWLARPYVNFAAPHKWFDCAEYESQMQAWTKVDQQQATGQQK